MRRSRSFQIQRRSSIKTLKPASPPRRAPTPTTKPIPQQMQEYIDARSEVEITVHY